MGRRTNAQIAAEDNLTIARATLERWALAFVDYTVADFDSLEGTASPSAPVEFMRLHDAAQKLRAASAECERLKQRGEPRTAS